MSKKFAFSLKNFARYIADQCNSEILIGASMKDDERFFVQQAVEYLDKIYPKSVKTEVRAWDNNWEADVVVRESPKFPYKHLIEAKFVSKKNQRYRFRMLRDIFRLLTLKEGITSRTHRLIVLGGYRKLLNELFSEPGYDKGAKKYGVSSEFPAMLPFKNNKPIKKLRKRKFVRINFPETLNDELIDLRKEFGDLPPSYHAKLVARYQPHAVVECDIDEEDKGKLVDVYIWRIYP